MSVTKQIIVPARVAAKARQIQCEHKKPRPTVYSIYSVMLDDAINSALRDGHARHEFNRPDIDPEGTSVKIPVSDFAMNELKKIQALCHSGAIPSDHRASVTSIIINLLLRHVGID